MINNNINKIYFKMIEIVTFLPIQNMNPIIDIQQLTLDIKKR